LPHHEKAKRDTIGVANAILPHSTSLALIYPMENEMPLIHHVVEWWGCGYTLEDDKALNERTQGLLMLKPMSKLMQTRWE
jgi:hypothetical protein